MSSTLLSVYNGEIFAYFTYLCKISTSDTGAEKGEYYKSQGVKTTTALLNICRMLLFSWYLHFIGRYGCGGEADSDANHHVTAYICEPLSDNNLPSFACDTLEKRIFKLLLLINTGCITRTGTF